MLCAQSHKLFAEQRLNRCNFFCNSVLAPGTGVDFDSGSKTVTIPFNLLVANADYLQDGLPIAINYSTHRGKYILQSAFIDNV
jgi:hypothetical protein